MTTNQNPSTERKVQPMRLVIAEGIKPSSLPMGYDIQLDIIGQADTEAMSQNK